MAASLALDRYYNVIGVRRCAETFAVNQRRNDHRATRILPIALLPLHTEVFQTAAQAKL
jgi:hypothetical protein